MPRKKSTPANSAVYRNLKAYKARLEMEERSAAQLHKAMLPLRFPAIEGLAFSANFDPESVRPGLFFEALRLDDDEIALYAFDVSGREIPSAYMTAMARLAFHQQLKAEKSAVQALREINVSLAQTVRTVSYVTAFLGIIDLRTHEFRYCNAGFGQAEIRPLQSGEAISLPARGGLLGVFSEWEFEEKRLMLHPGDKIAFRIDEQGPRAQSRAREKAFVCELNRPPLKTGLLQLTRIADTAGLVIKTIHTFDQMKELIRHLMNESDKNGYSLKFQKNFRLVLLELLTNAIIHGNQYDVRKKVITLWDINPQTITIGVIDEGNGYLESNIPNPLLPENMNKPHGRGLYIVKHYADEFRLCGKGNIAVLHLLNKKD